ANSAKSESTNTTIKGLIKLARGFRNLDNMITLIYLKCSDIVVPLCN
ncbi:MAG: transposase, partial [Butyrivibrio sp.]|nr:transposase [Butyrivibrio sp.]